MLEHHTLHHPSLPSDLTGITVAHLTDFHIKRPLVPRLDRIAQSLADHPVDIIAMTGDYLDHPGGEDATVSVMSRFVGQLKPRLGLFGVLGNHDTMAVRPRLASLPVRWLFDRSELIPRLPLEVVGLDEDIEHDPDSIAMLKQREQVQAHSTSIPARSDKALSHTRGTSEGSATTPFRLLLCHNPSYLPMAADLQMHLMLSGHTHGGQCRLPPRWVLKNSCDLPLGLSAGVLQHRATLCAISRGVGETLLPLRVFCPWHVPVYTLAPGPLPIPPEKCNHIANVRPW
jgi:uncharacterized protein